MAATSFDGGAGSSGALGVHAASRKIGKQQQDRKPVIIYMVSPKVIHVEAHDFMPLVQRLTGPDSGGRGDRKGRPSTTGGGASYPTGRTREQEGARNKGAGDRKAAAAPPVRVKARTLNRPTGGGAVSVSVTATRMVNNAPSAAPSPSGLMFHDLSPLRGAALKGDHFLSPGAGWLHHVGDQFLSPGAAPGLGSPSAGFLDIFGPLSSSQQQ